MCLYIGNKDGFVLKKDLVCFKQLEGNDETGYRTPCQGWPVKLDSMLVPDQKSPQISKLGFKWQLDGGAIHAYLNTDNRVDLYKAIIPKGTRVWIQDDLNEVAAEKMELTSEKIVGQQKSDLSEFIESAATDFYMKDGTRKTLKDNPNLSDVLGIYTITDKVVSINFQDAPTKFSESKLLGYSGATFDEIEKAEKDFNGLKNTEALKNDCKNSNLYATERCGQNEYLPSFGELKDAVKGLLSINLSREFLGLSSIPMAWFWTSSVRNEESLWICRSDGGQYWYCWGPHWDWHGTRVLPFVQLS